MELYYPAKEENNYLSNLENIYISGTEMKAYELRFLNSIILRNKPVKCLELGVAVGGSSVVILNAIKNIENSKLYSIDYSTQYYRDANKKTGYLIDFYPELKKLWKLYTGGLALNFMDEIGDGIDFCLIDTMHINPGEILDFLTVFPFLKDDCIVVFHDVNLHTVANGNKLTYINSLLMSSIYGQKIIPGELPDKNWTLFPNIGAIKLTKESKEKIWEVFNLLTINWQYPISDDELAGLKSWFCKYYGNYFESYFDKIILYNKQQRKFDINIEKNIANNNQTKFSFLESLFSVKNSHDCIHKIITILGIHIKIKRKNK